MPSGCIVTPGLVNTHHHLFQNLTRAYAPATRSNLFGWLSALYPLWSGLDEEAAYVSAWVGLAELALGGCTTSTDHLYVHPRGGGDLLSAEIAAARDLGMRFHPDPRLDVAVGQGWGASARQRGPGRRRDPRRLRAVGRTRHHDPSHGAMVRVALAPCSPFSVTAALMQRTGRAGRATGRATPHPPGRGPRRGPLRPRRCLGCRTIEHFEEVGWCGPRSWVAHCIYPNAAEIGRLGRAGVERGPLSQFESDPRQRCHVSGERPSSRRGGRRVWAVTGRPPRTVRRCGWRPGTRCCWGRCAMAPRRGVREMRWSWRRWVGPHAWAAPVRSACWPRARSQMWCAGHSMVRPDGFAWPERSRTPSRLCFAVGRFSPRHTIVAGVPVVLNGELVSQRVDEILASHRRIATSLQRR